MGRKYDDIKDGIPFDIKLEETTVRMDKTKKEVTLRGAEWAFQCCDCKLVHHFVFIPSKNKIKIVCWRDNRATAQLRRGKHLLIDGLEVVTLDKKRGEK